MTYLRRLMPAFLVALLVLVGPALASDGTIDDTPAETVREYTMLSARMCVDGKWLPQALVVPTMWTGRKFKATTKGPIAVKPKTLTPQYPSNLAPFKVSPLASFKEAKVIWECPGYRVVYRYAATRLVSIKGEYNLTDPVNRGFSDRTNNTVHAFWAPGGSLKHKCWIELEAVLSKPPLTAWMHEPRVQWISWDVERIGGMNPGDATFSDPGSYMTQLHIKRPGKYEVYCTCGGKRAKLFVYAVQVKKVRWRQYVNGARVGNPIGNDPGTGITNENYYDGRQRIFTELIPGGHPNDSNRVTVEAEIEPDIPGVPLHFQAFDVDDPSWNNKGNECDGDLLGDDNRDRRFDRGSPALVIGGRTDKDGKFSYDLRVPRQPGDNLVVACAPTRDGLDGVKLRDRNILQDSTGWPVYHKLRSPLAAATRALTTWRKVRIEMDRMEPVLGNFLDRRVTRIDPIPGTPTETHLYLNEHLREPDNHPGARGHVARFHLGELQELGAGGRSYAIVSNGVLGGDTMVHIRHPAGVLPAVGAMVRLFDDDTRRDGAQLPTLDSPRVRQVAWGELRRGYIVWHMDWTVRRHGMAPFHANYDAPNDAATEITPRYRFDNQALNHRNRWVVYVLSAFQYDFDEDLDPDAEPQGGTMGIVDAFNGLGASIFVETHSDAWANVPDLHDWELADSVVHELGHLFNARHGDGGLIDDPHTSFSSKSLAKIRSSVKP